ncbi:MAG: M4 family metallopeptidase [Kofleriaceae bacterium]
MYSKSIEKWAIALTALTACAAPDETHQPQQRTVKYDRVEVGQDGAPYYVRGAFGRASGQITDVASASALDNVLPGIAAAFRVPPSDLVAKRVQRDELGMTHVHYAQQKNGLRVVGGELVVHLQANGKVRSVNGSIRDAELPATPTVTALSAADTARATTTRGESDAGSAELVYVINGTGSMHLVWEIEVKARKELIRDIVYVDATSGRVVHRRPQIQTAKSRTIVDGSFLGGPGYYPLAYGDVEIGTESAPPSADAIAMAAYNHTGTTYDCLKQLFNRDSYNGSGGLLKSVMHLQFGLPGSATPNNAAWDGTQMLYGDGDYDSQSNPDGMFSPLAEALDVTAHELGHGVTSATANLTYMNESGALNEGMSDIIASVCESWKAGSISANTWLVGEDIFTPATAGDALRYMNNPTLDKDLYPPALGGSRDFYAERYTGTEDSGGVHLNSGIANLAFYLSVAGGKHPRNKTTYDVPAIGMEKASKSFFRALTMGYFTAETTFAQARTELEEVAGELYPSAVGAVGTAWAAVGVGTRPAPDAVPPTIDITAPGDGTTVAAGFTIEATAADDKAVLSVEFAIDGTSLGSDKTAPYAFTTLAGLAPGTHTVTATAYDAFNETSDSITVTVPDLEPDPTNPDPTNPTDGDDDGEGGGCCSTGSDKGAVGSLLLFFATMLTLRRRRR